MAEQSVTTQQVARKPWPPGIPFIVANEGCERFSYYGMRSILKVFLVALYLREGLPEATARAQSTAQVHLFVMAVYATPLFGAVLADRLLGKYRTILWLSLVYCVGHGLLAVFEHSPAGFMTGLALIALGAGGIKPCVSAHVGDQFTAANWSRIEDAFRLFYLVINLGALAATLAIPWLRVRFGWGVAFGIPGVLMALATLFFWLGRKRFVHVPPAPGGWLGLLDVLSAFAALTALLSLFMPWAPLAWRVFVTLLAAAASWGLFSYRQRCVPDDGFFAVLLSFRRSAGTSALVRLRGLRRHYSFEAVHGAFAVLRVLRVFGLISLFWALWDQYATSWLDQGQQMHTAIWLPWLGSCEVLAEQLQAANPLLILLLVPVMGRWVYPWLGGRGLATTPLARMTLGMWLAVLAFLIVAVFQYFLDGGVALHVLWQLLPYLVLTASEVLVSITGLEFAYTQAPPRMKSLLMSLWLLAIALGNGLTSVIASQLSLDLLRFFLLFAGLMACAALIFGRVAQGWRYRDFPQPAPAA